MTTFPKNKYPTLTALMDLYHAVNTWSANPHHPPAAVLEALHHVKQQIKPPDPTTLADLLLLDDTADTLTTIDHARRENVEKAFPLGQPITLTNEALGGSITGVISGRQIQHGTNGSAASAEVTVNLASTAAEDNITRARMAHMHGMKLSVHMLPGENPEAYEVEASLHPTGLEIPMEFIAYGPVAGTNAPENYAQLHLALEELRVSA